MIPALFLLIVSIIAMIVMVLVKVHKMNQGKEFVFFKHGEKTDEFLREKISFIKLTFSRDTLKISVNVTHAMLDRVEGFFIKGKDVFVGAVFDLLEKAKGTKKNISPNVHKVSDFIADMKKQFKRDE